MKQISALIVITALFILALPGVSYSRVSSEEKEALNALKVFIRTHSSKRDRIVGWRGDWNTISNWEGLTVKNNKVTGLDLSSKDLQGELPRAISKLKYLESLVLNHNKLTHIPIELGKLKHLKILSIYHNKLQGPIPKELGKLQGLQRLNLSDNDLSGSIPPELGKLSRLHHLDLSDNDLSGPIPPVLGRLSQLRRLNLSDNDLSGPIPPAVGTLDKLAALDLSENSLSGPVPRQFRNLSNLEVLDVSKNKFRGAIPGWFMRLAKLKANRSDFRWNALYVPGADKYRDLRHFLSRVQRYSDWNRTQTVAPTGIYAKDRKKRSIKVGWQEIPHVSRRGYYIVCYKKKDAPGDFKKIQLKNGENFKIIKGLEPSTTYQIKVFSVTLPHGNNKNRIISEYSYIKEAPTKGTTISGTVKHGGKPLKGVKIVAPGGSRTVSAKGDASDETGENGEYYINVTSGWSGTLALEKKGYKISPLGHNAEYQNVVDDKDNQDFQAETISMISGKVMDKNGEPVAGVVLTFMRTLDGKQKTAVTAPSGKNGRYFLKVKPGWTGRFKPVKTWYPFEPAERTAPKPVFSQLKNQDFVAQVQKIKGRVTRGKKKGLKKEVALTLVNGKNTSQKIPEEENQILTNKEDGSYSFILPSGWTGSLHPVKPGYFFYPGKKDYPGQTAAAGPNQDLFNFRAQKDWTFSLAASGTYMLPAQETFSGTYGSGMFIFGIKGGLKFVRPFYIWAGYDYASATGKSPVLNEKSVWKQRFFSLGLGYNKNLSRPFDIAAEAGMLYVKYDEKAMKEDASGSALGLRINGIGIYKISGHLFLSFTMSYLWISETVDSSDDQTFTVKLGGFKTGFGLGLRF